MTTDPGPRRRPPASGPGLFALPDTCPDCGGGLRAATLDGAVVFICTRCPAAGALDPTRRTHACAWRFELGFLYRVDPPGDPAPQ